MVATKKSNDRAEPPESLVGAEYGPPHDVLSELARAGEERDPEARRSLEDELVRQFVASPEAKSLTDIQSCHFVMDFAAEYFNATIATLRPGELHEIVFDIIPRRVSIDASAASWIVEENCAFLRFLQREFGLKQADACLGVLGGDAVKKLEAALSDTSKFGMAKAIFMAGRDGFAMTSEAGIEEWTRTLQSRSLPAAVRLPGLERPSRAIEQSASRRRKNQRKAARKARKRSR